MIIKREISLEDFEAWSGGEDTLNRVIDAGNIDTLESILEEEYPDGIDEASLNDLLRFEPDFIYECVGMPTESEIREKLEDAECELEDIQNDMNDDVEEYLEYEGFSENDSLPITVQKCVDEIRLSYQDDILELTNQISDLKDELAAF